MSKILLGFCNNAAQIAFFGSLSSSATYLRFPLRIMHCLPSSMHLISAMRHSLRMLPFFASNFWSYDTNLSHNFCACIFVQDDSYFKISFVLILMTTLCSYVVVSNYYFNLRLCNYLNILHLINCATLIVFKK